MHRTFTAACALTLALAAAACGGKGAAAGTVSEVNAVNVGPEAVAVATVATLSSGPEISGSLVAEKTAAIRAEVGGAVVAVLIDPGVRVAKGAVLARVDDSAIRDAWLSAKSAVTQAQLTADIAARDEKRAERLLQAGAIAENALESARRSALAGQAALEDAKARLASAQKNLDNTVITSPYDGIVSERQVNAGDIVSPGTALFTVVDPSTMRLEGAVPAEQLGAVRVGAPVRFSVTGYPGRAFEGAITSVYPSADPQTRQVRLFARIPNAGAGLVAGLYATGRIASATRRAITAPLSAVDQRGIRPVVLRLKNGKADRVEVTLGLRDDATERVELTAGVAAGDTLLTGAAQGITPGTPIRVSAATDKPATIKQ